MVSSEASCTDIPSDPSGVDGPVPTDCWPAPGVEHVGVVAGLDVHGPGPQSIQFSPGRGVVGDVDVEVGPAEQPCRKARMSGPSPTPGVSATVIFGALACPVGAAVDEPPPWHPPPRAGPPPGLSCWQGRGPDSQPPVVRGPAADQDGPHYFLGSKMQDSCGQFGTCRGAREYPATGGRQGKRPLHRFFPVMRELLPVGRLAVRVSP